MLTAKINTTDFNIAYLELWQNKILLVKKSFKAQKKLSDKLLPNIIKLLEKNEFGFNDLDYLEVYKSEGGSFTGQRVGMAVAKALGFGLGINVKILKLKPHY